MGARLVEIETAEENQFIGGLVHDHGGSGTSSLLRSSFRELGSVSRVFGI